MPVCKQWVMTRCRQPKGIPVVEDDFELLEENTDELRSGEILCRALFLSVDPIVRLYIAFGFEYAGQIIPGHQVARIVESRHKEYPKGKLVIGCLGWQTYSVVKGDACVNMGGQDVSVINFLPYQLENTGLSKSACLGVLGIPGLSAYIGLIQVCKVVGGETVVISSAAGQIGHIAGQIAKHLGCMVIGFTGDSEKTSWLKTDLGFDWAINYNTQNVKDTLKIAAPNGVDIFMDSVGGIFHSNVIPFMKFRGRVCILGNLSNYNNARNIPMVQASDMVISLKELSIYGFNVYRYRDKWDEALEQLAEWCAEGVIQPHEHFVEGFENLPKTLVDQMSGKFQGKVIVRV